MSEITENAQSESPEQHHSISELPPPDFGFLVYSLRLQAELSLGLLPFGDEKKPDFNLARHHIDLLAMLQEKTRGNLTMEEQRALDNSVTELRFRFIQAREQESRQQESRQPEASKQESAGQ
jgi:hypothetical protein